MFDLKKSTVLFMKQFLLAAIVFLTALNSFSQNSTDYNTALGMRVDFGSAATTYVGLSAKHFFTRHDAGEAQLLFGTGSVLLGGEYQYHGNIQNANGLKWYAGLGTAVTLSRIYLYDYYYDYPSTEHQLDLLLRPIVGLDLKVPAVPLNFCFDWRPAFELTHGTAFAAARFGLGFRYAF